MYDVFDIANWFLKKQAMEHKKLQKLCYYAQAWYYTFNERRLIDGNFEGWVHGPVNRRLWNALSKYGYLLVPSNEFDKRAKCIELSINDFLERVWATYGKFTGGQLEALTHTESPWINSRSGLDPQAPGTTSILLSDMKKYYSSLISADGIGE